MNMELKRPKGVYMCVNQIDQNEVAPHVVAEFGVMRKRSHNESETLLTDISR
jgi:hypothetical protein